MAIYLKDNFDFDFGLFSSKILMVNTKVSSMIEKFAKTIEDVEVQSTEEIEIIEDLGTIKIPEDLIDSLFSLTENLKNQVFFNSVATSIYSFLEFSLIEYCRLIDCYLETEKSFLKYPNSGLDKIKGYLKDNFSIDFGTIKNWDDISKFQKVRNLIVHNDSNIIKDYDKSLEEQLDYIVLSKMTEQIEITSTGTIFIKTFDYLNKILVKITELINDIIDKTKEEVKKKEE